MKIPPFYRLGMIALVALTLGGSTPTLFAQGTPAATPSAQPSPNKPHPQAPPVLTKAELSAELTPAAITTAMRKVADWQLEYNANFNRGWVSGVLYTGIMAAYTTTGDAKYHDAMMALGEKFDWHLGNQPRHADDQCIAQSYLELYLQHHDPKMIAETRQYFDETMASPNAFLSWCDALFMQPPGFARLYKATGEKKYMDFLCQQWWKTSQRLYDPEEHLYYRDATFFPTVIDNKTGMPRLESNGKKIFWSRGNGWVVGGLVRVLQIMPQDHPERPKFIEQFKEMTARLLSIQGQDGLWRSGLLDPDYYQQPENSGSALFVYGFAWGINEGILDRATYLPAVQKAWAGLLSHVYADGRFGSVQGVGMGPGIFKPTSTDLYGVGAFLLAGSELHRLALHPAKPAAK